MAGGQLSIVLRHVHKLMDAQALEGLTDGQLLERFISQHEEAAFAALVRRHGPMVLGVCRRVLHHWHAAEDAFQATFLVLFRRAGSLDRRGSLANWLYTVAYHVALKARANAAHRRQREKEVVEMRPAESQPEEAWRDLQPVLDEELNALPDKYRAPIVLCYVEGKTNAEAARLLGWPVGTVKGRLARARELLQTRLTRRGITLSGGLLGVVLAEHASAAVPGLLVQSTIKTIVLLAAGKATAGLAAAPAAALAEGVLKAMFATKLKIATGLLLAVGVVGIGIGTVRQQVLAQRQEETVAKADPPLALVPRKDSEWRPQRPQVENNAPAALPAQPELEERKMMTVDGRVLDAQGKAVADAQVAVLARSRRPVPGGANPSEPRDELLGQAKVDREGHFHLAVPRTSAARFWEVFILGRAAGHGLGWQRLNPDGEQPEVTLQLPIEQVIHGRLVELQGQPAAGVTLRVAALGPLAGGDFGTIRLLHPSKQVPLWPSPVTTDKEGRFVLRGLNRELGVNLQVRDEPFAFQWLKLPTEARNVEQEIILPLAPSQIVSGSVTYADSGKPAAQARVNVDGVDGRTDEQGRFRLNPYPGDHYEVIAYAPDGEPYLGLRERLAWPKGAVKREIHLALPRGVLVRGKITERGSGKAVAGASIQFVPRASAADLSHIITGWEGAVLSGSNGDFRIAVPLTAGSLFVHGPTPDYVLREILSNKFHYEKPGGLRLYAHAVAPLDFRPGWNLLEWIARSQKPPEIPLTLQRGVTVKGRVVGPNDKPVAEALLVCRPLCVVPASFQSRAFAVSLRDGYFEIPGCDPEGSCRAFFLDARNKLGAAVEVSGKQGGAALKVRLAPCGSAVARFVDAQGNPLVNYSPFLKIVLTPGAHHSYKAMFDQHLLVADEEFVANIDRLNHWDRPRTDAQGRCTFPALIPGVTYRITSGYEEETVPEFTVESGKTVQIPDITVTKRTE